MKIVPDTNVLIELFRAPAKRAAFEARMQRPHLHMSSIVLMELLAGCRTRNHERAIAGFLTPFRKEGRIVTPDYGAYEESGRVLAGLMDQGIESARSG